MLSPILNHCACLVTPGLFPVIAFAFPQRLLTSVLFPELGTPITIARTTVLMPLLLNLSILFLAKLLIFCLIIFDEPDIVLFNK